MVNATRRWGAIALAGLLVVGCATGRSLKSGEAAATRGDWDAAVAYFREALAKKPGDIETRLALERAMREASNQHLARARTLEAQEQWAGAAAEYRLAADLQPSNALAVAKAIEIERKIRAQVEAARPPTRMDQLRQQAEQASTIKRLDPRVPLVLFRFNNTAIRDILKSIGDQTGINVTYDEGLQAKISVGYTIDMQNVPIEEALNLVLSANKLVFKVINPTTIFVYEDTQQKRQQWDDQYQMTFYLSNAEAADVVQLINQMLGQGGTTGPAVRPTITQNKSANAVVVRATLPVLELIKAMVASADKPRAEVLVDVQILEVSRTRMRELGIDLSAYALGFALVPDVEAGTAPPANPPPIRVSRLREGIGAADFFTTLPTGLVRFLENDQNTKLLARPQLRGREGAALTLNLGDEIPYAQTSYVPIATGGVPTQPQVSYAFKPIGVNLSMTPRVTYQDEIILDPIMVDKSNVGPSFDVGGGVLAPSFSRRTAQVSMRLRDGESNLLAGLIREEDRTTYRAVPGLSRIPILRSIFGAETSTRDESELVMIVTPYIIRSREITADDLRPLYIGSGTNFGGGNPPSLVSPDAPPPLPLAGAGGATQPPPPGGATPPPGGAVPPPPTPPPAGQAGATPPPGQAGGMPPALAAGGAAGGARAPGVVALQPVTSPPAPQATPAQLVISSPAAEFQMGGAPYSVPINISNVSQLGTITVTVTYDPAVLKADAVVQGSFMQQGGATPTFAPKIDAAAGRIDIVVARSADQPGATGAGLIAGIVFKAVGPGTAKISVVGVAATPEGRAIPVQPGPPATVVVK